MLFLLRHCIRFKNFICFLYRLSGGELFDRLVEEDYDLRESDCITYMRQICQGVHHMHQNNIIHLDLKVTICGKLLEKRSIVNL